MMASYILFVIISYLRTLLDIVLFSIEDESLQSNQKTISKISSINSDSTSRRTGS